MIMTEEEMDEQIELFREIKEEEKKQRITIKDYASMPKVLIDGRVFVDRDIFIGYVLNLLQQELDNYILFDEKFGLEVAMDVIENIK